MMKKIAYTLTGSRLYGTHHAQSDYDYVTLYVDSTQKGHRKSDNKAHKLHEDQDNQYRSLDSFLESCAKGSPNDLDTLFSPLMEFYAPEYRPLLTQFRPNYGEAYKRCLGMISAYEAKMEDNSLKATRHMFRIAMNGYKLQTQGWYNPRMTKQELARLEEMTQANLHLSTEEKKELAKRLMDTNRL